ncbi:MAG: hypothetical protein ABIJ92_00230 [Candidatus Aenigmatarchaeota archaeon]
MEKLKIYGIKKNLPSRIQFILEKDQKFINVIQKLVTEFIGHHDLIYENETSEDVRNDEIEELTDRCDFFDYGMLERDPELNCEPFALEVFVGQRKVLLNLYSSKKFQEKFTESLLKHVEWGKLAKGFTHS